MTINETRVEALRVIEKVIRLQYNVNNGCFSDTDSLEVQKARLVGIKAWAVSNDQLPELKHFFAANNFGQPFQFIASELSEYFY